MSCPLAALIQPLLDSTTVIGSLEIRSFSSNAFASSTSTILLFLSSPYSSRSSFISFLISVFNLLDELRIFSISLASEASNFFSSRMASSSNLANCLKRMSKIAFACNSDNLNFFIKDFLGSSWVLIIFITSSRFK